jgi:hypothetical protein
MTPLPKRRQPGFLVYLCGIGTTLLVLWLVEIANNHDVNPMGWYVNGIIPAGALLVGILSGVGYAIGARMLNVKLSKAFVLGMITTGLIDYVAAQWITYANLVEKHNIRLGAYSFLSYMRDICEHMSFRKSGSNEPGTELGMMGYFFKGLEMVGFALGVMIPCVVLRGQPYCVACQRYLQSHAKARTHSPVLTAEIKKLPRKERPDAVQAAVNGVAGRAGALLQKVATLPLDQTLAALKEAHQEWDKKSTAGVLFQLSKCPQCDGHHIATSLHFTAANGKPGQGTLPALEKAGGQPAVNATATPPG